MALDVARVNSGSLLYLDAVLRLRLAMSGDAPDVLLHSFPSDHAALVDAIVVDANASSVSSLDGHEKVSASYMRPSPRSWFITALG